MLSIETLKVIKERPEFQELLKYLAEEAVKLNSLSEMAELPHIEIVQEVLARKRAYETLKGILGPIVDIPEMKKKSALDSYEV